MTLRVPDTLTADNSEKYEVSIRLWPGGLSFSGCIPSKKDSFFSEMVLFDTHVPIAQSLKNVFFDNVCCSYVYRSLYVVCVSRKYTFVPDGMSTEKNREAFFSYCHHPGKNKKIITQSLEKLHTSLLFEIDNEVYEFLIRSLVTPQFVHHLSPLLIAWQKKSRMCYPKQIYAYIHDENMLDVVCFEQGEMLFANAFECETVNDMMYYIMYACKRIGVDQLADPLHLCGDRTMCHAVMAVIREYIEQTDYLPSKMDDYLVAVDQDVFIDVLTLTGCGL